MHDVMLDLIIARGRSYIRKIRAGSTPEALAADLGIPVSEVWDCIVAAIQRPAW